MLFAFKYCYYLLWTKSSSTVWWYGIIFMSYCPPPVCVCVLCCVVLYCIVLYCNLKIYPYKYKALFCECVIQRKLPSFANLQYRAVWHPVGMQHVPWQLSKQCPAPEAVSGNELLLPPMPNGKTHTSRQSWCILLGSDVTHSGEHDCKMFMRTRAQTLHLCSFYFSTEPNVCLCGKWSVLQ